RVARERDRPNDHTVSRSSKRLHKTVPLAFRELRALRCAFDDLGVAGEEIRSQRRRLIAVEYREHLLLRATERLDENLDVAAACEPDLERDVVGHAERGDLRLTALQDFLRLFEDGPFDASVRDGPRHLPRTRHQHLRTQWPRARAPCLDHGRDRDVFAGASPLVELAEELPHLDFLESRDASSRPRSSRAATLCAARKSSQCGSAAAMPRVSGSYP